MEGYISEIRMFGGNFAPRNWAFCDGQLIPIAQNNALFSLIGTIYGGDGRTTMALPDLRGRHAVQPGTGPGLTSIRVGQRGGNEQSILNTTNLPAHNHTGIIAAGQSKPVTIGAYDGTGGEDDADGNVLGSSSTGLYAEQSPDAELAAGAASVDLSGTPVTIGNTGSNIAFSNRPPFLGVYHIICLFGTYPSRS